MVSSIGFGAGQIGDVRLAEKDVDHLLNSALDAGVSLIDTAPGYGLSEARIGCHIGSRRGDFVLSTKLGYGVAGFEDWTGPCITAGIEQALHLMRTDRLDIAHLHSCPRITLERGDVIDALERAKREGKILAMAYSGENHDLAYAVAIGRFDGFMASLNIFDQRVIDAVLPNIEGKGFIAKRPSANHPWRFGVEPVGNYCEEYWRRWRTMNPPNNERAWGEVAIRFALSVPAVSSAIVGTSSSVHLKQNLDWAAEGELDASWFAQLRSSFLAHDRNWLGQI